MENKLFSKTMKPFVTNKSGISNDNIMIVDNERLITDDKELARMLNDHYINIIEKAVGLNQILLILKRLKTNKELLISSLRNLKIIPVLSK